MTNTTRRWLTCFVLVLLATQAAQDASAAEGNTPARPAVGDLAPDFDLQTPQGENVKLSALVTDGPVVLIVLRGFPGYQCPACTAQVGQFVSKTKQFQAARTRIVMVYPGPADGLKTHAADFVRGKSLPENCYLVLDPDYRFTKAYQLRWKAKNETAYPATFVIDRERKILFTKISMSHGGRASVDEVLKVLAEQP